MEAKFELYDNIVTIGIYKDKELIDTLEVELEELVEDYISLDYLIDNVEYKRSENER